VTGTVTTENTENTELVFGQPRKYSLASVFSVVNVRVWV